MDSSQSLASSWGDGLLLGLISNNMADTWLRVAIAVVSLIIGFAPSGESTATAG